MNREEATKRLEGLVTDVALEHGWSQDAAWAFYDAIRALSSPCACRGATPLAEVKGGMLEIPESQTLGLQEAVTFHVYMVPQKPKAAWFSMRILFLPAEETAP